MGHNSYDNCYTGLSLRSQPEQAYNFHIVNLNNVDAVDKWIDLHYQVVWSILFVLAGVRLRRNRKTLFLLSYSHSYPPKLLRILIDLKKFFLTQSFLRISNTAPSVLKNFPFHLLNNNGMTKQGCNFRENHCKLIAINV